MRPEASLRALSSPCLEKVLAYGMERGWKGFDPYDALLSPVSTLPVVRKSRHFRLAWTQVMKRSPLNLRNLWRIDPTTNSKALALCLSGSSRAPNGTGTIGKIESLTKGGKLVAYEAHVKTGTKRSEIQVGPNGEKLARPE